jgi:ribose-phosphate pyrophosphokinase
MTTFADTEPFLKRLYERIDYAPEPRDASLREILGLWRDARQGELVPPVSACRIDELGAAQAAFFMFGRRGPRDFTVLDAGSQAAAFLGLDLHTRPSPIPANRRAAVRMRRLLAEVDRAGEPVLVAFTARNHAREAIHVEMIAAPVTLPNGGRALIGGVALEPSRAAGERQTRSSPQTPRLRLFALGEDRALGDAVASALGISLAAHEERNFEDGEHKLRPLVDVTGCDVFVLHRLHGDASESANDRLCRLLFFIATLKDAGAASVTAVAPYLCYARKDRRTKSRDPVTMRYLAQLFDAVGADRVISLEVHNQAAFENAFRCPTTHLGAAALLCRRILPRIGDAEVAVVSPDLGGGKRADFFRATLEDLLMRPVAKGFVEKSRSAGVVSGDLFAGDVAGRIAIIVDDIIASGTTIARAARLCRENGAREVIAVATHGLFSGGAGVLLEEGLVDGIIVTDAVPFGHVGSALRERIEVTPIATLLADAIRRTAPSGLQRGGGSVDIA